LGEAIAAFRDDSFAKQVMGADFHAAYVKYKEAEWQDYCLTVGEWESKRYLQLW
jgi:glutamine synthetase